MRAVNSSFAATTISAAADGVGARRSATKSAIVTSTSWPTAEMTGTGQRRDRPRHDLLVERPQVFDRSAAAPDDDDVDAFDAPDVAERAGDVGRGAVALDARRRDDHVRVRIPPAEHLEDVADRRAVERGDDADLARQRRQRPLARRVEQPLGLQALLELLERQLQGAEPLGSMSLADDLVLALRLVDAEAAARDDVQAVLELELQRTAAADLNMTASQLRAGVLQREVDVAGVPQPAVGDLALDPDVRPCRLEQRADRGRQLR